MASYETLDYTICFNGHNVTCFKVGSVPTIGYASLEDAIQNTNSVILPDMVFDAVEDILDHGIIPTTIWIDFNPVSGHGWCNWEEETVLSKADIVMIEESNAIRKTHENRKQRRSARRVQNARHKKSDRLHGKGVFSYEYKENRALKTQILPDNMRSKSAWSKACHEWGDPDGLKRRVPRTQSVNVHKDTKPIPEQEPWYVGVYGTLEVCKDVTVTMEWPVPEAVQGEPV